MGQNLHANMEDFRRASHIYYIATNRWRLWFGGTLIYKRHTAMAKPRDGLRIHALVTGPPGI